QCYALREDYLIGNLVRHVTHYASTFNLFDYVLDMAESDPVIRKGLLDSVSGHENYINIIKSVINRNTMRKVFLSSFERLLRKNGSNGQGAL
ncbi:MAG: hypothetical protein ACE5FU_13880, partial [Nitrospinota bacterium]